ncbi:hypothetical protein B0H13DRAFT_2355020 [Mycena leptocephala]|nr:hypothetical protein B0H13DRAFT_2355020 [Mycena leptocephala]
MPAWSPESITARCGRGIRRRTPTLRSSIGIEDARSKHARGRTERYSLVAHTAAPPDSPLPRSATVAVVIIVAALFSFSYLHGPNLPSVSSCCAPLAYRARYWYSMACISPRPLLARVLFLYTKCSLFESTHSRPRAVPAYARPPCVPHPPLALAPAGTDLRSFFVFSSVLSSPFIFAPLLRLRPSPFLPTHPAPAPFSAATFDLPVVDLPPSFSSSSSFPVSPPSLCAPLLPSSLPLLLPSSRSVRSNPLPFLALPEHPQ